MSLRKDTVTLLCFLFISVKIQTIGMYQYSQLLEFFSFTCSFVTASASGHLVGVFQETKDEIWPALAPPIPALFRTHTHAHTHAKTFRVRVSLPPAVSFPRPPKSQRMWQLSQSLHVDIFWFLGAAANGKQTG